MLLIKNNNYQYVILLSTDNFYFRYNNCKDIDNGFVHCLE